MKNLPNILTVIRTVLALILLFFFKEMTVLYIVIFSVAMFTDLIDGTIARKLGCESYFGAVFDSIADLLLDLNIIKLVIIFSSNHNKQIQCNNDNNYTYRNKN